MSHFTTVQVEIHDLECLKQAAEELGGVWMTPTTKRASVSVRGWGSETRKAVNGIRCKGRFDIAVDPPKNEGEPYLLAADLYDGSVERQMGKNFGKLSQRYGVLKVTKMMRARGKRVVRKELTGGRIELEVS